MWRQAHNVSNSNYEAQPQVGSSSHSSFRDQRLAASADGRVPIMYAPPSPRFVSSHWAPYAPPALSRSLYHPFDSLTSLYQTPSWGALHSADSRPPSAVASVNTSTTSNQAGQNQGNRRQAPAATTHAVESNRVETTPATSGAIRMPQQQQHRFENANAQQSSSNTLGRPTSHQEDLVHSQSFVAQVPSSGASSARWGGEGTNNAASISVDIEALQQRMVSLSTVNVQLQQELDAARHEIQRAKVDQSRLKDQLQISQAQETFLKSELEKVVARQQQLLSFERTPEGLGRAELLEQQNRELKEFVGRKEDELRAMQGKLQESMQRVQRLNTVLSSQDKERQQRNVDATPTEEAFRKRTLSRSIPLLCQAHRDATFTLKALMALRHVALTPHGNAVSPSSSLSTSIGGGPATCSLTQRHCTMKCLTLASQGIPHGSAEEDSTSELMDKVARRAASSDELSILDELLTEVCDTAGQQLRLVVSSATAFLAKVTEEEAMALDSVVNLQSADDGQSDNELLYQPPPPLVVPHRTVEVEAKTSPMNRSPVSRAHHESENGLRDHRSSSEERPPRSPGPVEVTLYALPSGGSLASERSSSGTNMIRVERSAQRRSPTDEAATVQQRATTTTTTADADANSSGQRRLQHRPSIQPPRRGTTSKGTDRYGGCEQQ